MGVIYTVSDGTLMLNLESADEGGYIVSSPLDPQLVTQAETIEEAFLMAYDAQKMLIEGRVDLARRFLDITRVVEPAPAFGPIDSLSIESDSSNQTVGRPGA